MSGGLNWANLEFESPCEPPVLPMLRLLHRFPVGRWLKADPTRRAYSLAEWIMLLQQLQAPSLSLELCTVPIDDPLPVTALLQLPEQGLLACGAHSSPARTLTLTLTP